MQKMHLPNFNAENEIFVLSLHYNGDNSYFFVNGTGLSGKDFNDIKLYRNVYDFSVDYSAISNDEILKIHKYLMKKNGIV